ncbi:modulator of smoothened protein isoform X3 [Sagmatias obliquidens]|uniref:modulator of smoothened protein isoform X3 n=1 Tax=Sagmatias obliquidens TaxID=3371155 RepID=UPI000F4453E7|nr:modulator of smoothened protein isoform X3 [Lagenorhynchus obliquidens]XP_030727312.1 modulator of smoothened protein isoform X3 [Globicephala melas]
MDKLTIISGCLFLAADIFAIASIANPDWINTGESADLPVDRYSLGFRTYHASPQEKIQIQSNVKFGYLRRMQHVFS